MLFEPQPDDWSFAGRIIATSSSANWMSLTGKIYQEGPSSQVKSMNFNQSRKSRNLEKISSLICPLPIVVTAGILPLVSLLLLLLLLVPDHGPITSRRSHLDTFHPIFKDLEKSQHERKPFQRVLTQPPRHIRNLPPTTYKDPDPHHHPQSPYQSATHH